MFHLYIYHPPAVLLTLLIIGHLLVARLRCQHERPQGFFPAKHRTATGGRRGKVDGFVGTYLTPFSPLETIGMAPTPIFLLVGLFIYRLLLFIYSRCFLEWWVWTPNHPLKNRLFHYFHHPFWSTTI